MYQFLSDEWFAEVAKLNELAGDLNVPPSLQEVFNASLLGDDAISLHLKDGKIHKGLSDMAAASISIDKDTLGELIAGKDMNVAMEAFMTGKLRIDGDMSKVMGLQTARPTPEQKALYKQILAITNF